MERGRADILVVDSAAFIKRYQLQNYCKKAVTIREVVAEIKDPQTRQSLQVLPYELEIKEPGHASVAHGEGGWPHSVARDEGGWPHSVARGEGGWPHSIAHGEGGWLHSVACGEGGWLHSVTHGEGGWPHPVARGEGGWPRSVARGEGGCDVSYFMYNIHAMGLR